MEQDATTSGRADARDETDLLDVLHLLIETKKAKTTADLVKYAAQYGAPEAEERLRVLDAEGIPLALAYDAISVHLRILEYKRSSQMVASCRGKKVGLVLPVPHHVMDLFMPVAEVELLHPSGGALHGPVQDHEATMVKGSRACRAAAARMEVVVFEAFRGKTALYVDADVVDVLEAKLHPSVILLAHLRPHKNPQDIAFTSERPVAFV